MKEIKTGLVLSGGGTRGVAHAGALQFLAEKNIKPEVLACCSSGSIVGALYAVGKTPQEILAFFKSVYFFNWRHFTFNKPGLLSSLIFADYLTPIFEDMTISELELDVRIIATELVSGEQKIFSGTDKIVDAIIASCSIPGITVPYIVGNVMYSDGGVLNNFPADIIHQDCDKLIGMYVSPVQDVKIEDLQSIKSVTTRAYELMSHRIEIHKFSYCDWIITSKKLANYGTFERNASRLQEIFEIGYQAAKMSYDETVFKEDI
ncbi:patatin-like phospholipase family protein [Chryseobacterium gotjawalense]|uniref:Patatin-like phospholipase family protein n=1 Tax=Chryseobacterium gotjawalense TaxID=3042315 RepID=A0ABY8RHG7_9FLAO|nr:patatin-like phospholipase family protein [Chryseobacterium sp. wdc7]WHF52698.1 patatin-like phospholipase family protein [Chryseobacterium sp. wdc7]